jgi:hypothetical protein
MEHNAGVNRKELLRDIEHGVLTVRPFSACPKMSLADFAVLEGNQYTLGGVRCSV